MDWAGQAVIECIMAIAFGLFIGWVIVTGIKVSRSNEERRERRREKRKEEQETRKYGATGDFPWSNAYLDTIKQIERERVMKEIKESSKQPRPQSRQENESGGGGIDEYHK